MMDKFEFEELYKALDLIVQTIRSGHKVTSLQLDVADEALFRARHQYLPLLEREKKHD